MSKRMAVLVLFVIAFVVALVVYQRHRTYNHFNGGEVTAAETREPAVTASIEPTPAPVSKKPPAGQPMNEPATDNTGLADASNSTDTLPANPPERATFRGTGRFQVYRQGNLTWRLDSESGDTCVLFATDAEWRNPRVYNRACAND